MAAAQSTTLKSYEGNEPVAIRYDSIVYATMDGPFSPATIAPAGTEYYENANRTTQLHLTVTTPLHARAGQDLPVVFYIHGGAYSFGDRTETWYDGRQLAQEDVILVACDYRLGAPGFVQFGDSDPNHYPGIDDCALALRWVQDNIEAFGGDPTNVTLAGQSAGGGIVLWLCRKDHYQGMFRRAWALSPAYPRKHISARTKMLRRYMQVPLTRKHLNKLALTHPEKFTQRWQRFIKRNPSDMVAGPCPFDPKELAELDVIVSCTDKELNAMALPKITTWYVPKWLRRRINQKWGAAYSFAVEDSAELWLRELINNVMLRRFVTQTAQHHHRTWIIYFTQALHCDEIAPLFHSVPLIPAVEVNANKHPHPQAVARTHGILRNFAHGKLPSWPQASADELHTEVINIRTGESQQSTTVLAAVARNFPVYRADTSRSAWTNPD